MPRNRGSRIFIGRFLSKSLLLGILLGVLLLAVASFILIRNPSAEVATRNAIAAAERQELADAQACFDTIGYPNADLMGDILPTLDMYLHAATRLDELLCETCGTQYSLLDAEMMRYVYLTMDELRSALSQGLSTDGSIENLSVYMLQLKNDTAKRFDERGYILAMSKR